MSSEAAGESGPLVEVSDQTWEHVVEKGEKPVVVMFYSPQCPYCRTMLPFYQQYANEFKEKVLFARLDISTSLWTAERYGVRGTPTFKFFCGGKAVSEIVGAIYPAILKKMIEDMLVHGKECAQNRTEITGYG